MKKLVLAATLIMGAIGVNAQSLEIIPKAGINIASQAIKGASNEKSKVGFQGGVGLNILTGAGGFSVQPELNFVSKGTSFKTRGKKENYNLNYLELPVLAKYSFGQVYVNAGPSIGFLLGQSDKSKVAIGEMKKIDFGIQMGAGVAIPAGPGKVIVDGRYNLGLSNISDVKSADIKNRGIMVSVGYAIALK
ncbi:MAG: porin family protein [Flavobacteriales bacterium]